MSDLISIALYVLQAIGFYTIAKRRGIAHAWLAFIPFGSAWILGALYDDYKARFGKRTNFRLTNLLLSIATVVLAFAILLTCFSALFTVMDRDGVEELLDIYGQIAFMEADDLYAPTEEEFVARIEQLVDQTITDAQVETLLTKAFILVGLAFVLMAAAIAAVIIQCICMYNLFESCDPGTKMVFFLLGLFIGLWPVFVFVDRNKDLGLPQGIPASFEQIPPQEPWNP